MIIAIDIGNTAITLGVVNETQVRDMSIILTGESAQQLKKGISRKLRAAIRKYKNINTVYVCSVVPQVTKVIRPIIKSSGLKVKEVGKDMIVPLCNKYRQPSQVGQDRLVGAYAVKKLYGYPAIIIDFGTAITFDLLSAKGDYEGGIIVPGIRLTVESLFTKTALLPHIESIKAPRQIIGKTTVDSILSGIFYGYGTMASGLVEKISRQLKKKPVVILTGGYTGMMKRFLSHKIDRIDDDLVLKGLGLIAYESRQ